MTVILFLFLGNSRATLIVALTIPFSLLFAAICLECEPYPGKSACHSALSISAWSWMARWSWSKTSSAILRTATANSHNAMECIRLAAHEVQRPVFYARAIIIAGYMPIFTLQSVEGRLFKPMAWTVAFALLGGCFSPSSSRRFSAASRFGAGFASGTTR